MTPKTYTYVRMVWAGMTDMIPAAQTAVLRQLETSSASPYVAKTENMANNAGTKTHTSFRDTSEKPTAGSKEYRKADVIIIPGNVVVPIGRPIGYQDLTSYHNLNCSYPCLDKYSVALKLNQGSYSWITRPYFLTAYNLSCTQYQRLQSRKANRAIGKKLTIRIA